MAGDAPKQPAPEVNDGGSFHRRVEAEAEALNYLEGERRLHSYLSGA